MKKEKIHKNDSVKHRDESTILHYFLRLNTHFLLLEHPIVSIANNQLNPKDSRPDSILLNHHDQKKYWAEITTVSHSKKEYQETSMYKTCLINNNQTAQADFDLESFETILFHEISIAIKKKSNKRYQHFAKKSQTQDKGILIIYLLPTDQVLEKSIIKNIISKLDKNVLIGLECGKSCFNKIVLITYIIHENSWAPYQFEIADTRMMEKITLQHTVQEEYSF